MAPVHVSLPCSQPLLQQKSRRNRSHLAVDVFSSLRSQPIRRLHHSFSIGVYALCVSLHTIGNRSPRLSGGDVFCCVWVGVVASVGGFFGHLHNAPCVGLHARQIKRGLPKSGACPSFRRGHSVFPLLLPSHGRLPWVSHRICFLRHQSLRLPDSLV